MQRDFIIFIHGVNIRIDVRDSDGKPVPSIDIDPDRIHYADTLFDQISAHANSDAELHKVALYWGGIDEVEEEHLLALLRQSEIWNQVWFKDFRESNIVEYVGDAVLYVSRLVGAEVVRTLLAQTMRGLASASVGDRLHLVTHSWGTVILFDILFSSRWDYPNVDGCAKLPGQEEVQLIRSLIFGLGSDQHTGIRLGSITTMGSPLALFSLMGIRSAGGFQSTGHDINKRLAIMLKCLSRHDMHRKLPWHNFIHPGDPIAFPVDRLIRALVDPNHEYLSVRDIVVQDAGPGVLSSLINRLPFNLNLANLLLSGDAHGSYWTSKTVAKTIAQSLTPTTKEGAGWKRAF